MERRRPQAPEGDPMQRVPLTTCISGRAWHPSPQPRRGQLGLKSRVPGCWLKLCCAWLSPSLMPWGCSLLGVPAFSIHELGGRLHALQGPACPGTHSPSLPSPGKSGSGQVHPWCLLPSDVSVPVTPSRPHLHSKVVTSESLTGVPEAFCLCCCG